MAAGTRPADRREAAEARRARRAEVADAHIVMEAAAAFLAVRPRSVAEVRRRLRHLGFQATLADAVVDRLVELGYLDDRAFATAWVESRDRARPRGALALRKELARKGLARDVVDDVLAERATLGASDPDAPRSGGVAPHAELVAAARLLERRMGALQREPDLRRRRQRAYALLARNGFTPDVCGQAVAASFAVDPDAAHDD